MTDSPTCIIERNGVEVFKSYKRGITPLIEILDGKIDVCGCTANDIIVGKAASLLYVLMRVRHISTHVLSKEGENILKDNGITYSFDILTDMIVNRKGSGICPMEECVRDIYDPNYAYIKIKNKLAQLNANK